MAAYTSYDITGIFDVLDFASNNQTLSSYDITGIFDDLDFASNNQTLSSYDITGIFDDLDFASNNQTLSSYDITGVFDSLDFATESPQKTIILPSFAVNPIVDPATILINEGDSEPAFSVAFTASVSTGSAPLTVNFTNNSVGPITEVHWDFGDGGTSTAYSPSHTYTNSGNYTVYLRVFAGPYYSQSSTVIQVVSVTADFSADLTTVNAGSLVTFTDTSTGTPTSWNWDFGDGSIHATTQNPTHIYTVTGTYTVTLIATNAGGSDTEIKTDYITVIMTADFTGTPTSGPANLSVAFTDTSTGTPTSWDWDFGDGSIHATTQYPTHIYTVAGTYTVTLIATAGSGSNTKIKTDYIVVGLLVDFSADPVTGQSPPLFVRFSDLTAGNPTTWSWSFGDGETSSLKNPVHLYNSAGVYTVSLTASNLSASGTRTRVNYITAIFYRVSTKDMSPPVDRIDLRTMYGEGDSTYRYPKKGVQISTAQDTETDSGFTRPYGPTLIFD